ncbi:MAG TPA: protein translocase subunit SecD [Actinomycetota bacterium]|nr:protein translocase subunit SecD [Actinomycetota bacterium]
MKTSRHVISLALVLLLAGFGVLILTVFNWRPKLGLDLRGGLSVVLAAKGKVKSDTLDKTVDIISDRVNSLGVAEPDISRQGDRNIIVQLPDVKDPDEALRVIGKTAELRFRPVLDVKSEADAEKEGEGWKISTEDAAGSEVFFTGSGRETKGQVFKLGPAAVLGSDIDDAMAQFDQTAGQWLVSLELKRQGREKFADITRRLAPPPGQQPQSALAIVLDEGVVSAPVVETVIEEGEAQISGGFEEKEARELAIVLQTGALPITLEPQQHQVVSPTLGSASLKAGLMAGMIGLAAVAIYMLLFYRLFGLVTLFGLGIFSAMLMGIIGVIGVWRGFTLTLAGIAGIIVSVGIAADSYIIYFERIKDELKEGKTFRSAVDRGFASAIKTNIAANSVAFTAAIILYLLAVGPVRGFALTLGISALLDIALLKFYTHPAIALLSRKTKLSGAGAARVGMKEVTAAT